jgi:hypothetical protein
LSFLPEKNKPMLAHSLYQYYHNSRAHQRMQIWGLYIFFCK